MPRDYDHFHTLQETERLVMFLENRAHRLTGLCETLEGKMPRARRQAKGQKFSARLGMARQESVNPPTARQSSY